MQSDESLKFTSAPHLRLEYHLQRGNRMGFMDTKSASRKSRIGGDRIRLPQTRLLSQLLLEPSQEEHRQVDGDEVRRNRTSP